MKKTTYIIALLLLSAAVQAQAERSDTVFTQDVSIVRAFTPTIQDAGKISTLPSIERPEPIGRREVNYLTWISPITLGFELQTLPAATLTRMRHLRPQREGFVRIGAGNYTSFLGDVYVPLMRGSNHRLDFMLNHLSTFGNVTLENEERVQAKNMTNAAQLLFTRNFFNVDLNTGLKFQRRDFNYFGLDSLSADKLYNVNGQQFFGNELFPDTEAHNMFDFNIAVNSRPRIGGTNFGISTDYRLTTTLTGLTENHIDTRAFVSSNWDIDELGVGLSVDNLFYNSPEAVNSLFTGEDGFRNHSVIGLNPFYTFRRDTWSLRLGLNAYFSINRGRVVNLTPDIHGRIALVDRIFYFYGGVGGDYRVNSMRTIFNQNQYVRPDIQPVNTYIPINAYAGLKMKLFEDMIFNGFARYKHITNQHFFVNSRVQGELNTSFGNTFEMITAEAGLFNLGASITYNWNYRLNFLLRGAYNQWSVQGQEHAWHKPTWELDFNINYRIIDDLRLTANFFALGKRHALGYADEAVELRPILDLNLSAIYNFSSWLSFYANLNNIFAQNRQLWYGVNSQRFNFMAGAIFSF